MIIRIRHALFLHRTLRSLKNYRKTLPRYVHELEIELLAKGANAKKISENRTRFLNGKSLEHWLNFCDIKISEIRKELQFIYLGIARMAALLFLLVFLSLSLFVFFSQPKMPVGYLTLEEIAPNATWYSVPRSTYTSWEPIAAYSDRTYENHIGYDESRDRYYLVYLGDDINLSYIIDPDPTGTAQQVFNGIYVNTSYLGREYYFRPNREGLQLELDGKVYNAWDNAGITREVLSKEINGKNISLLYRLSLNGDSVIVKATYSIKGKVLILNLESDKGKVASLQFARTGGEPPEEYSTTPMTYASKVAYSIRKENLFVKIYNDFNRSSATRLIYGGPSRVNLTQYNWNIRINYEEKSNGERNPLNETIYIVVSPDLLETYPQIPNPASPYRDYFNEKIVLDYWYANASFNNYYLYSQKLRNYGMTNLHVIIDQWGKFPWPEFIPPSFGGEAPFIEMVQKHNSLGYNVSVYTIWQDIYRESSYYNDYYCMHNNDGTIMQGWCSQTECTCPMKYERRLEVAQTQVPTIHSYGVIGEFSDAIASGFPDKYVDKTADGAIQGMYIKNLMYETELIHYLRDTQAGPISSEGYSPLVWVGILDTYDATSSCCNNSQVNPVVVDYVQKVIRKKVQPYAGYYRIFLPANNNPYYRQISDEDIDKYIATNIAFGHTGRIDSTVPWLHNISDRTVVRIYYMWKELQKQYSPYEAEEIKYYSNNEWKTLSEAMRDNYDFVNAQIRIAYSSGLVIYVNRHSSSSLTVDYNGTEYTIPPSGWLAYNPGIFFEFSGILDGTRVDIAETLEYVYIDPRNTPKKIVLHDNHNYTAKTLGDGTLVDIEVGLLLENGFTAINTDVPLIMYRQPETLGDTKPPEIFNISIIPNATSAIVVWETDELADSKIIYEGNTAENTTKTKNHFVKIENLLPGTEYSIAIRSSDGKNIAESPIQDFKTTKIIPGEFIVKVDESEDIYADYSGVHTVSIEKNRPIAKFAFDFSGSYLDLRSVSAEQSPGFASVTNLDINKTLYLETYRKTGKICIKDSADSVSSSCTEEGEILLSCPGTYEGYSCVIDTMYEITGLMHSAVREYYCNMLWTCTEWSECNGTSQTRDCSCGCIDNSCLGSSIEEVICEIGRPPEISGITVEPLSTNSIKVRWETDELSDSVVDYWSNGSINYTKSDHALVASHEIMLSGLSPNTIYTFTIRSTDADNESKNSEPMQFTTPPPKILAREDIEVTIGNSTDLSILFNTTEKVVITANSEDVVRFMYDFRNGTLDLRDLEINKTNG
ncbi:MAG: fibronectin type III domain-containing protein, partial [Candidatus Woesearchaeota archaeon]